MSDREVRELGDMTILNHFLLVVILLAAGHLVEGVQDIYSEEEASRNQVKEWFATAGFIWMLTGYAVTLLIIPPSLIFITLLDNSKAESRLDKQHQHQPTQLQAQKILDWPPLLHSFLPHQKQKQKR